MKTRTEKDSFGEIAVPADKLWAAQTQRSLEHFQIGTEKIPIEVIFALTTIKKACGKVNFMEGKLDEEKFMAIDNACNRILSGELNDHFPLSVWQTGSGTQSNMNVNEVIGNIAGVHPNDDVNMSQSSNDTFPSAMHIAALITVEDNLYCAIDNLASTFNTLSQENRDVVKIGRTHLQDATPLTLAQEISAWMAMLVKTKKMIVGAVEYIREIALGATAVGTGLNASKTFGESVAKEISDITGKHFITALNKFHALTSKDELVNLHGAIKSLAMDLMKIANDVRMLSSGPRCGIGEILIPENEPGSSIMPGKVNPTQCEALTMVAVQVFANDTAISFAASQGNFQLNVFMPVLILNFIQSVRLLSDSMNSFNTYCAKGIKPNMKVIENNLNNSLMLVTALNSHIGYDNAAKVAKFAHSQNITLKESVLQLNFLTSEEFDRIVVAKNMV